jgi:hypothetical protein
LADAEWNQLQAIAELLFCDTCTFYSAVRANSSGSRFDMTEQRQMSRAKARQRRAEAKSVANKKIDDARSCVAIVVSRAQEVIATKAFVECARKHAITTVPEFLAHKSAPATGGPIAGNREFGDRALDFVIAWRFFYPLFSIPEVAVELARNWPGFIAEMKDAFILLVTHGPFPEQCCAIGRPARKPFPAERKNSLAKPGGVKPRAPASRV